MKLNTESSLYLKTEIKEYMKEEIEQINAMSIIMKSRGLSHGKLSSFGPCILTMIFPVRSKTKKHRIKKNAFLP
jgi:hypothetical protein